MYGQDCPLTLNEVLISNVLYTPHCHAGQQTPEGIHVKVCDS